VNARSPMMWVTVLASQPSESIPTEMRFWTLAQGLPGRPTVSTCWRRASAIWSLVRFLTGPSSSSPSSSSPGLSPAGSAAIEGGYN